VRLLGSPAVVLVLLLSSYISLAQAPDLNAAPPNDLVRRVVGNELKSEQQDHSHWSFRLSTYKPGGQSEVDDVIETKDGDLNRPILVNGHPVSEQQRRQADAHIQQLVHNPAPLRKSRQDEDQDAARSQRLLKMLPDAFIFKYGERHGDLVQLNFSPNPSFRPRTHEAEVFHAMQGCIWVDARQQRLAGISGRLMHEVKFGGGFLGHLNPGGTFEVKQAPVARGYWELTLLKVQMTGKALFFKTIGVQQNYTRSDFKQVPDNLSLAKAAEMLQQQQTTASLNQGKSAR
jgi:hypothetical protein